MLFIYFSIRYPVVVLFTDEVYRRPVYPHVVLPPQIQSQASHFCTVKVNVDAKRFSESIYFVPIVPHKPLFNLLTDTKLELQSKYVHLFDVLSKGLTFGSDTLPYYILGQLMASDGLRYQFIYGDRSVSAGIYTYVFINDDTGVIINIAPGRTIGGVHRHVSLRNLHNDLQLSIILEGLGAQKIETYNIEIRSRQKMIHSSRHVYEKWVALHEHFLFDDPKSNTLLHAYAVRQIEDVPLMLDAKKFALFPGSLQVPHLN